MKILKTIEWIDRSTNEIISGYIRFIDQTLLPEKLTYIETTDLDTMFWAIKTLQVRGAPAIGIAAAMAIAATAMEYNASDTSVLISKIEEAGNHLATSRPTAVNLFWAIKRMISLARKNSHLSVAELKILMIKEACIIRDEDAAMCRAIGRNGAELLKDGDTVLTHCNAGGLATAEFGTALAPIYTAVKQGKKIKVYADETRPLLQGSRLTAWELMQAGIDVTVICDNMAAQVMKEGKIDVVMVGSDRIAANGDAANKIGTYGLALLAKAHNIPFYVLAPSSTIDNETITGNDIPIEERAKDEVIRGFGKLTAPDNVKVYSPAFDVTPRELITAIITEK